MRHLAGPAAGVIAALALPALVWAGMGFVYQGLREPVPSVLGYAVLAAAAAGAAVVAGSRLPLIAALLPGLVLTIGGVVLVVAGEPATTYIGSVEPATAYVGSAEAAITYAGSTGLPVLLGVALLTAAAFRRAPEDGNRRRAAGKRQLSDRDRRTAGAGVGVLGAPLIYIVLALGTEWASQTSQALRPLHVIGLILVAVAGAMAGVLAGWAWLPGSAPLLPGLLLTVYGALYLYASGTGMYPPSLPVLPRGGMVTGLSGQYLTLGVLLLAAACFPHRWAQSRTASTHM